MSREDAEAAVKTAGNLKERYHFQRVGENLERMMMAEIIEAADFKEFENEFFLHVEKLVRPIEVTCIFNKADGRQEYTSAVVIFQEDNGEVSKSFWFVPSYEPGRTVSFAGMNPTADCFIRTNPEVKK